MGFEKRRHNNRQKWETCEGNGKWGQVGGEKVERRLRKRETKGGKLGSKKRDEKGSKEVENGWKRVIKRGQTDCQKGRLT